MILGIETSAKLCSIAFGYESHTVLEYNLEVPMQHAVLLGQFVELGVRFIQTSPDIPEADKNAIDLAVVAIGPGSFTGLRIGLSYAQGFCFGRKIPIVGISNHQLLAWRGPAGVNTVYTIIDARREEVYLARLDITKEGYPQLSEHALVPKESLPDKLPEGSVLIRNEQVVLADETVKKIQSEKQCVLLRVRGTAADLLKLGNLKRQVEGPDDLSKLEPLYIRPFAGVL
ncbi:MAG TPA: tRNA (adenosine(37)-N6)-threonylcarbamoyltransferase complex dimerization subunit type 1 TsaB [Caldithrix abyssi]|uniref:tRNA (Adenosine(37)-N6)-threonylcarbamoyltransferase complex dimerization subunit type 1 TsaB n=1 Tax=Caldithrix abyssi TaxID=187145 RepID=A0A7V4WU29_CALAY|nr:tRNA (adenosine(37)-N6)-threonylcarbamoyltransferase complex dimerization subunit type 1 TsaB [Caldithrix abyssi]